jgi:hypothetical protein
MAAVIARADRRLSRAVTRHRNDREALVVVFGHQWESKLFGTDELRRNIGDMFRVALSAILATRSEVTMALDYRPLKGGYGEHLFNECIRKGFVGVGVEDAFTLGEGSPFAPENEVEGGLQEEGGRGPSQIARQTAAGKASNF